MSLIKLILIKPVLAAAFVVMVAVGSCLTLRRPAPPTTVSDGDAIVVCGHMIHTGAPVIRWDAPDGFNAYLESRFFTPQETLPSNPARDCDTPQRYGVRGCLLDDGAEQPISLRRARELIRRNVDLIVLHYDAAGSSRRCFEVLHDERGLSAHFLIDLDGTIYQTLDVRERARHAGSANDRSVGIEIANIGAYEDPGSLRDLAEHLVRIDHGKWDTSGAPWNEGEPVVGNIQGRYVYQYRFTGAQYESLVKLTRALFAALPSIRREYPRDRRGRVPAVVLSESRRNRFSGILGHYHVSAEKIDPGPAFDWNRFLLGIGIDARTGDVYP